MLLRLAYVSQLNPDMTDERIARMIEEAASANASHGVTGIIALEGLRVCQVIEGDSADIDRLFSNIRADMRHAAIIELDRMEVSARRYPDWSMVRLPMVDMVLHAYAVL
ncbi:MAG: BLUF domain-containing protein [Mesorhizobium sp.]|nr:BLUF domain-containing protein [Mesorhizobium sp.]MBL8578292.1 BLUF domain-containing protein [Mesorhizobium sp.]